MTTEEMIMQVVNQDVINEPYRQNEKWGVQRHEHGYWLAILVEEVGEVAQAIQQGSVASKDTDADDLYTELIHVAAVASAIAEQVMEERGGVRCCGHSPELSTASAGLSTDT